MVSRHCLQGDLRPGSQGATSMSTVTPNQISDTTRAELSVSAPHDNSFPKVLGSGKGSLVPPATQARKLDSPLSLPARHLHSGARCDRSFLPKLSVYSLHSHCMISPTDLCSSLLSGSPCLVSQNGKFDHVLPPFKISSDSPLSSQ